MTSLTDNITQFVDGHPRVFAGAALLLLVILVIYYLHNAGYIGGGGKERKKGSRKKRRSIDNDEDLDSLIDDIHSKQGINDDKPTSDAGATR